MTKINGASMMPYRQTTPRHSKAENEVEATPHIDPKRRKQRFAWQNIRPRKVDAQPPDEACCQPAYLQVPVSGRHVDGHRLARDDRRLDMFGAQHTDGSGPGHRHRSGRDVGTGGAIVVGQEFSASTLPAV